MILIIPKNAIPTKSGSKETEDLTRYKETVSEIAKEQIPEPFKGLLSLSIIFYLDGPEEVYEGKKPTSLIPHLCEPPLKELEQTFLDTLDTIVWENESQVWKKEATKYYTEKGSFPRTVVIIREE